MKLAKRTFKSSMQYVFPKRLTLPQNPAVYAWLFWNWGMKLGFKLQAFYFFRNLLALLCSIIAMPIYLFWGLLLLCKLTFTCTDGSSEVGFPWDWDWKDN